MSDLQRSGPSNQNRMRAYLYSIESRGERRRKAAPPHAERSSTATVNLETDPGRTGVEDRPCTVTDRQLKKTLLYIIDIYTMNQKTISMMTYFGKNNVLEVNCSEL
jgi:hypothetical protein